MDSQDNNNANDNDNKDIDIDEIELTLRRFAMIHNSQPLTKLLNSMFPTGIATEEELTTPDELKKEKE